MQCRPPGVNQGSWVETILHLRSSGRPRKLTWRPTLGPRALSLTRVPWDENKCGCFTRICCCQFYLFGLPGSVHTHTSHSAACRAVIRITLLVCAVNSKSHCSRLSGGRESFLWQGLFISLSQTPHTCACGTMIAAVFHHLF